MNEPLLEVKGIKKYFPLHAGILRHRVGEIKAVDGVDFSLHSQEILGIVGESGCGKSTLARAALRLLEPTAGQIFFEGKDLLSLNESEMRRVRRDIQVVFQDPYSSLNPRKTIGENIGEPLLYHSLVRDKEQLQHIVAEILKRVGIPSDAMNRYPHQFSGGQQQRICIGRAIGLRPKILVCDEAVSSLDVSVRAQILNLLIDLQKTLGLSYLFISHDLSIVRYLCDRVLVLYLGKVMETATTEELFNNPKHPYTQALLSAIPRRHPKEKGERLLLKGEIPSPSHPPSGCPFRTRCPFAQPICSEPPPRKKIGNNDHEYDCILD